MAKENQKGRRCPEGNESPSGAFKRQNGLAKQMPRVQRGKVTAISRRCSRAEFVLFCRTKENQKGRRCPEGMKAPVGLLSRRPVREANAACSARQGHSDFEALQPGVDCSLLPHKREPEKRQRFRRAGPTRKGLLAPFNPKAERLHTKKLAASLNAFLCFAI